MDRELLELAAKAAGLPIEWDARGAYIVAECIAGASDVWNPLTDDGDALRLAVKLRLHVDHHDSGVTAWVLNRSGAHDFDEDSAGDPYAATRRAIVRAAAEIGKATS